MKPGLRTKNSHQLFLFSSLFLALLLAACGTLQVDLAPTPGSTPRPGVPITPTPWFGPAQYETEAGVIFDDRLKLLGYTVKPDGNEIESRITVTLIWEVLDKIDADYNTFVHLFNKEEQLLAQSDQPTGGGWRQSSDWIIKEYVYDQHHLQLPNSMSLDDVVIQIGLYDFNDGRRLDVESPNSYTLQVPAPTPGRPPANLDSPKVTNAPQIDEPDNMATSPPPDESFPDVTPGPTATPHVEKTAAAPSPGCV